MGPQVVQNLISHGSVGWEGVCGTEEAMAVPHLTKPKMRAVHNEQFSDKMEAKMVLGT